MKFDLVKEELSTVLENLTEQFEMIDTHQDKIPQIELDIFMRNIQKLYEHAIYLNKENQKSKDHTVSQPEIEQKTEVLEKMEVVVELIKEEEKQEIPITEIHETKEIVEEKIEATLVVDVEEEKPEEPKKEISPEVLEELETSTDFVSSLGIPSNIESSFDDILDEITETPDLFSGVKVSKEITDLNKKLADARNTRSIVEKLQNQRIESLKSVIGINDKFYFINELFSGDSQKYEDIIYTLNNFKKLDEAMQYFSTLRYRFNWDEESAAYEKLTNMLERKFNLINA